MGWSCNRDAGLALDAMSTLCIKQTGSSNQYLVGNKKYFFETSRREHDDGAITGQIWKHLPDGTHIRKSGSFRIEGNGTISRGPAIFKAILILFIEFNGMRELWRGGEVTQGNLNAEVFKWQEQYKPGGCNEHIGYGVRERFPAVEVLQPTGETLIVWEARMFVVD